MCARSFLPKRLARPASGLAATAVVAGAAVVPAPADIVLADSAAVPAAGACAADAVMVVPSDLTADCA